MGIEKRESQLLHAPFFSTFFFVPSSQKKAFRGKRGLIKKVDLKCKQAHQNEVHLLLAFLKTKLEICQQLFSLSICTTFLLIGVRLTSLTSLKSWAYRQFEMVAVCSNLESIRCYHYHTHYYFSNSSPSTFTFWIGYVLLAISSCQAAIATSFSAKGMQRSTRSAARVFFHGVVPKWRTMRRAYHRWSSKRKQRSAPTHT